MRMLLLSPTGSWAGIPIDTGRTGLVGAAGDRPLFTNDIARMRQPDKAKSEDFVNALCDRIQPNSSQGCADIAPLKVAEARTTAIAIGKRALIVTIYRQFAPPGQSRIKERDWPDCPRQRWTVLRADTRPRMSCNLL